MSPLYLPPLLESRRFLRTIPVAGPSYIDPTDLAGVTGWYDFSTMALADNDPIVSVTDLSAAAHNLTTPGAGNRPTYQTNVLGALSAAQFDGTDDRFDGPPLGGFIGADEYTIFVVFRPTAVNTNDAIPELNDAVWSCAAKYMGLVLKSTGAILNYNYFNPGYDLADPATTYTLDAPVLIECRHEGGNLYIKKNNAAEVSEVCGTSSDTPGDWGNLVIGAADAGGTGHIGMYLFEAVFSNVAESSELRDAERSRLLTKYGI